MQRTGDYSNILGLGNKWTGMRIYDFHWMKKKLLPNQNLKKMLGVIWTETISHKILEANKKFFILNDLKMVE